MTRFQAHPGGPFQDNGLPPVFDRFPKRREELPPEFRAIYETHYKRNRQGETRATSLSMRMESWLHRQVAADVRDGKKPGTDTLEVGAGMLNQLPYESSVTPYDIVEPFTVLYRGSEHLPRIRSVFGDMAEIPKENRYDRITSVATFEHILNLPEVVARAILLLRDTGSMRVSIPNEGTFLWNLGTRVTGFEFRRLYGLDYQVLMRYEHVNTADEIEEVLRWFFRSVDTKVYGISRKVAFYRFMACSGPQRDRAARYLAAVGG